MSVSVLGPENAAKSTDIHGSIFSDLGYSKGIRRGVKGCKGGEGFRFTFFFFFKHQCKV